MRKVILGVAVSLDGFIEGPNGEYDWCFMDQDYGMKDFMSGVDTIIMGRKSYDVAKAYEGESPWKGITTYVFSNTLKEIKDKNTFLAGGDIKKEVKRILDKPGKDAWLFGGAELTASFLNFQLVNELWLSIHPILLGSGKSLFNNINGRKNLKLIDHKVYDTGLVSVRYQTN